MSISKQYIIGSILFLLGLINSSVIASDYQQRIDSIKKVILSKPGDSTLVKCHRRIGRLYRDIEKDSAIHHFNKSIQIATKSNNVLGQADGYFNLGVLYYNCEEFDNSLKEYLSALSIYIAENDTNYIIGTYTNIGNLYAYSYDKQATLDYYIKALNLSTLSNDSAGMANNLNNIGLIYKELKNYEKAITYLHRTLEIDLKASDIQNIANSYSNLGLLFIKQRKFEDAFKNLNEAYQRYQHINDADLKIEVLSNFGEYYLEIKQSDSAYKYIGMAIDEAYRSNRKRSLANNYFLLGKYFSLKKNYSASIKRILKAIQISESLHVTERNSEFYQYISDAYYKLGDYKNAYLNKKTSQLKRDSLHADEVSLRLVDFEKQIELAKIQTEFRLEQQIHKSEYEKKALRLQLLAQSAIIVIILLVALVLIFIIYYRNKTKANKLLKRQNEIIEHQAEELKISVEHLEEREKELEQLNVTKDKFFSIIAHDLKNPFNIILGYADILNTDFDNFDEAELKRMINEIDKSSKITYNLLDNLLTWSRSQQGKIQINKELYNLKHLVEQSCEVCKLNATNKNIKISIEIPIDYKLYVDRFTISTAIGNLLSNAIKFTQEGGLIAIYAEKDHKNISINIKDTGIGMSEETAFNLFNDGKSNSTLGTNNESGTGLGLIISQEFVKKNGGEISVVSELGKGSIFTFTFPISKIDE